MLLSEQFETTTNTEITVVKTFCDFGHNIFEKQLIWPFFIRTLARSYEKNLATLDASLEQGCQMGRISSWLAVRFSGWPFGFFWPFFKGRVVANFFCWAFLKTCLYFKAN